MDNINMNDKIYITVLDFETAQVFQYEVSELDFEVPHPHEAFEDYLTKKGHNINNIEWMTHRNDEIIKDN